MKQIIVNKHLKNCIPCDVIDKQVDLSFKPFSTEHKK